MPQRPSFGQVGKKPYVRRARRDTLRGMSVAGADECGTCRGTGELPSETGPMECADCHGLGRLPSGNVLAERRLRELERKYRDDPEEHARDVRWLVAEVRRARHALVQILTAGQEAAPDDPIGRQIVFLANEVLDVYRPVAEGDEG
jgi:hypothetical protein